MHEESRTLSKPLSDSIITVDTLTEIFKQILTYWNNPFMIEKLGFIPICENYHPSNI